MKRKNESTSHNELETQHVVSAGGVVFRTVDRDFEVALIFTGGVWCLPKGLVEENETFEETALREVKEETGLESELVGEIGDINYSFFRERRYSKTVHFYLLKHVGGSIGKHDFEAEEVKWFPFSDALRVMAYPSERKILAKAIEMLKKIA